MTRLNITLVSLNDRDYTYSISLGYLKAVIQNDKITKSNAKVKVLNIQKKSNSTRDILYKILKTEPDIIGFSCDMSTVQDTLNIITELKKLKPNIMTIIGGSAVLCD